jgi:hypothetical protein
VVTPVCSPRVPVAARRSRAAGLAVLGMWLPVLCVTIKLLSGSTIMAAGYERAYIQACRGDQFAGS